MPTRNWFEAAALVAASLGVTPALAQRAGEAPAATLEEVVVTAQRREESLHEVPLSVSAFESKFRDDLGLGSAQDMFNLTPGVATGGGSSVDVISIRGIGRLTAVLGTDSGVAVYSNGYYGASTFEAGLSSLFSERVEVLRGPQGTLYGRNSIAGAINYISRRPTDELEAEARALVGDYDAQRVEGRVAGPLSEHLRASVTGSWTQREQGYFHNTAGEDEGDIATTRFVEAQLAFDIGTHFEGWLRYMTGSVHDNLLRNKVTVSPYDTTTTGLDFSTGVGTGSINPAFGATLSNPSTADHRQFANDTTNVVDTDDLHTGVLHLTWHFPAADLRYVGGASQYKVRSINDADNTPFSSVTLPFVGTYPVRAVSLLRDEAHSRSHELTLTSTSERPLQWIVGYFYYHENREQPFSVAYPEFLTPFQNPLMSSALFGFAPAAANPNGNYLEVRSSLETETHAAFAQLDYDLSSQWHLTIGARYSLDTKDSQESERLLSLLLLPVAPGVFVPGSLDISQGGAPDVSGPFTRSLSDEWNSVTGTAALTWTPTPATTTYLRYGRGYKSGGFNIGYFDQTPLVAPEKADAFELGWKQLVGEQLVFESALFYNLYHDAQVPALIFVTPTQTAPSIESIPQTNTYGLELATAWAPLPRLRLLLNYTYLNAEMDDACCFFDAADPFARQPGAHPTGAAGNIAQDLHGNTMPNAPRHKVGAGAIYTMNFGANELLLAGTYAWSEATYSHIFNTADYRASDTSVASLRATWRRSNWELVASLDNVFDHENVVSATTNGVPFRYRTIAMLPPRTWSLEARVRFP